MCGAWSGGPGRLHLSRGRREHLRDQRGAITCISKKVSDLVAMIRIRFLSCGIKFLKCEMWIKKCSLGLPERTTHFIFAKISPWLPSWNEQVVLTQQFQQRTFRWGLYFVRERNSWEVPRLETFYTCRKYFDSGFYHSGPPPKCKEFSWIDKWEMHWVIFNKNSCLMILHFVYRFLSNFWKKPSIQISSLSLECS